MAALEPEQKWGTLLSKELAQRGRYEDLSEAEWRKLCSRRCITSGNHDTVLSLDWPHYCVGATVGCGGLKGWCYTFHGQLAGPSHIARVAFNDAFAEQHPSLFANCVAREVRRAVAAGKLRYPNLRYSGSGELAPHHLPAMRELAGQSIHLWGFSRRIDLALALRDMGVSVIISCDATSNEELIAEARTAGFPLAYSSKGVDDPPPQGTLVTFPIHRGRFVREVVETKSLCPKVVQQYMFGNRKAAMCQSTCRRCHLSSEGSP